MEHIVLLQLASPTLLETMRGIEGSCRSRFAPTVGRRDGEPVALSSAVLHVLQRIHHLCWGCARWSRASFGFGSPEASWKTPTTFRRACTLRHLPHLPAYAGLHWHRRPFLVEVLRSHAQGSRSRPAQCVPSQDAGQQRADCHRDAPRPRAGRRRQAQLSWSFAFVGGF